MDALLESCASILQKFLLVLSRSQHRIMGEEFVDEQRQLGQLWKKARKDGCMSPWQQARVFGLSEAWQEMYGDTTYGKAKWISECVYVQGPVRQHPTTSAIKQLIDKMTAFYVKAFCTYAVLLYMALPTYFHHHHEVIRGALMQAKQTV